MNGWLYDAVLSIGERKLLAPIRAELLSPLSGEIVEIGAGTGASFAYYSAAAHVSAIEPDPSMLAKARAKRHRLAGDRITVLQGDDRLLDDLPENSADYVVAQLVLCSVENPRETLRRIHRILKPGGSLVTIEHVRSSGAGGSLQDCLTPGWRRIAGNCHLNRMLEPVLSDAGFTQVALQNRRVPPPLSHLRYGTAVK
jgi:SAM-dependent methyltransferase